MPKALCSVCAASCLDLERVTFLVIELSCFHVCGLVSVFILVESIDSVLNDFKEWFMIPIYFRLCSNIDILIFRNEALTTVWIVKQRPLTYYQHVAGEGVRGSA